MIARAARYDGPSLSIGPSDSSSLPRMKIRDGQHMLHLAHLPTTRAETDDVTGQKSYSVWSRSIFGKATKVAISEITDYSLQTTIVIRL